MLLRAHSICVAASSRNARQAAAEQQAHRDIAEEQQGLVQDALQLLLAAGLAPRSQLAVHELGNQLRRLVRPLHMQEDQRLTELATCCTAGSQ